MKKSLASKMGAIVRTDNGCRSLIPALVAASGSLAALPATALELGQVNIESSLGQPLRASIAYALGPDESLAAYCVSLQHGTSADGLPLVSRGSVSVGDGIISITGKSVLREPLMSMRVNVECPYTARLSREYMLFIDPAQPTPVTIVEPVAVVQPVAVVEPVAVVPVQRATAAPAPVIIRRRRVNSDPIANEGRYRVQPGDSLSQIAERIENRPVGLWEAVAAIFDTNPAAFIDNDPNQLMAGSWLTMPDFATAATATFAPATIELPELPEPVETPEQFELIEAPEQVKLSEVPEPPVEAPEYIELAEAPEQLEPAEAPEQLELFEAPEQPEPAAAASDATGARESIADLKPGDVVMDSNYPFVQTTDETIVIPDTELEGPAIESSSPNLPVAAIQSLPAEPASNNWLWWLVGIGLAIIGGLLFLSQRVRNRFGSTPIAPAATPQHDEDAAGTIEIDAIGDVDLDIGDDSPTIENVALDADLIVGTGLQDGTSVDVAQDFGFAATTALDVELTEEMSGDGPDAAPETDIMPPLNAELESILESEILPEEGAEDDYDMSVNVDATKMPHTDDASERDLRAIEVNLDDDSQISEDYTIDTSVDFKVLEQDYEDELTATQRLNEEIAKAAAELASDLGEDAGAEDENTDDTSQISLASVTSIDVTARLPANDEDEISDLDDTGINEAVTVNMSGDDITIETITDNQTIDALADDKTIDFVADDKTVEMPTDDVDETVEMETGRKNSKTA